MTRSAAVVIGRNEGPRLPRCLRSVQNQFDLVVYVDSASTDGSAECARALGVEVVALDLSIPFTFGRGRNAGAVRALELHADTAFIQFVDGDCELVESWRARAVRALSEDPGLAAVHGRVRERHPGASVYDRLYDLEFDPRTEHDNLFGGIAMLRVAAFEAVGRYAETIQGFEDHELSFRLRRDGWRIVRLDSDMVIHESSMTRWADWWRRERRAGRARARLMRMHGTAGAREWRRAYASIWLWGGLLPVLACAAAWRWGAVGWAILLAYALLLYRIFRRMRRRGFAAADAALYAAGRVLGKFPQLHGVLSMHGPRRGAP